MSEILKTGSLYVVATPIGHLDDLTRRAENVLKSVQIVAAEDTRRTRVLLDHISHRAPELVSVHEHNERAASERLLQRLLAGDDVALVSDAGTPLINDPGFELIVLAHGHGVPTVPVPGACAITAVLSVCPLPCHPFRFIGFLPAKSAARLQVLGQCVASADATVFLDAPHRILSTLADLATVSERRVMLGRELTKQYETLLVGTAAVVAEQLGPAPRGEFVGIIEANTDQASGYGERKVLGALLKELPPTQAAKIAASICGQKKSVMYDLALKMGFREKHRRASGQAGD